MSTVYGCQYCEKDFSASPDCEKCPKCGNEDIVPIAALGGSL